MADACDYEWRTWGPSPRDHICMDLPDHAGEHLCGCDATTSGTARQSVPDDGPGPTPPPGPSSPPPDDGVGPSADPRAEAKAMSAPSSPPDGGVGAPPSPTPPSLTEALEDLERTDPAVAEAAASYDRMRDRITGRSDAATSSSTPPSLPLVADPDDAKLAFPDWVDMDRVHVLWTELRDLGLQGILIDRAATCPSRDTQTGDGSGSVPRKASGPDPDPSPPFGRHMGAEEAAECFRTIVHDTDPIRRAMALSSLAAMAGYVVVSPPAVEQLVDVLRALRDRVSTEPEEDDR